MKGLELPVNTIIIVTVAVLVLVVVVAIFISSTGPSTMVINDQEAWIRGCSSSKTRNCPLADFGTSGPAIKGYDPDGINGDDNLLVVCNRVYGTATSTMDTDQCREKCCGY